MTRLQRQFDGHAKGFTLLELLIYIAVISVILVAATSFAFQFLATRAKASAYQEVERNAQFALARIAAEVRQADGYNAQGAGSNFGANPSTLSLVLSDGTKSPTVFSVTGGTLNVKQGAGATLPLTSSKVTVSEFIVDDLSTANGKSKLFRIHLKVTFNSDSLSLYAADTTVETTAQIKKADGFAN